MSESAPSPTTPAEVPASKPVPPKVVTDVDTLVWAKFKGSPWWPSLIADEKKISEVVLSKKPLSIETFPVKFLGSHDYSWISIENLKPFAEYREEFSKKKHKKGGWAGAFEEALDILEPENAEERRKRKSEEEPPVRKRKRSSIASTLPPPPQDEELDLEATLLKLRKKLQKFLLETHSEAEHFEKADKYVAKIEGMKEIDLEAVKSTKIGKVIRKISAEVFVGDTFNIASRCGVIVEKWISEIGDK